MMNIFGRHDLIQPWVATPIDVNRTRITIYTQLPEAFFDERGFAEKNKIYADFIRLVATEGEAMLESLQTGVSSNGYNPGPTVKLERAIHGSPTALPPCARVVRNIQSPSTAATRIRSVKHMRKREVKL